MAIKLAKSYKSITRASKELKISRNVIRGWIRQEDRIIQTPKKSVSFRTKGRNQSRLPEVENKG